MNLADTLNRTMKLALDQGRVGSYAEATSLFSTFRLRISVQSGFSRSRGAEAAVLTLLNAAPKTFLGGVELVGCLEELCTLAWFAGHRLLDVATQFGVSTTPGSAGTTIPSIHVGPGRLSGSGFSIGISLEPEAFQLSPDEALEHCAYAPIEVGVAAAGAALNEAFQSAYNKFALAGERTVRFKLPARRSLHPSPTCWVIGLGHLGQAFLWTTALAHSSESLPRIRLTDYDVVSHSSLSTCLLAQHKDVGRKKIDAVSDRLAVLGVRSQRDDQCVSLDKATACSDYATVIVAVDNLALRRSLDRLQASRILEAGIGEGKTAYTRVQLHSFPGARKARDVWSGDDPQAVRVVDVSQPAYQRLLQESGDNCGTALVAGRSVATPFVGAFAGALLTWLAASSRHEESAWSFDVNAL